MANITFLMDIQEGHILPSFELASFLKRRGHVVTYVSVLDNESLVREQGFEFYALFDKIYPLGFNQRYKGMALTNQNADKEHLLHINQLINGVLDRYFNECRPGLFISSIFLRVECLIIFYKYRIKPVFFIPYLIEKGVDLSSDCIQQVIRFPGGIMAGLMECLGKNGIKLSSLEELAKPLNNFTRLIACPEELEISEPDNGKNVKYLGPMIRNENAGSACEILNEVPKGKKIIYACFGSQTALYGESSMNLNKRLIHIMTYRQMQCFHLIIAVGPEVDRKAFEGSASNVTVLNWAPQIDILKVAAVAIIHGGLGTIKECIYFGVPMLIFPFARDQPLNATRVEKKGLGLSYDINTIRDEELIANLLKLDNDEFMRNRMSLMKEIFQFKQNNLFGFDFVESLISQDN